jgi:small GTP-binding protein
MSSQPPKKRFFQIVVLGGGGVGKSCLTIRIVRNDFTDHYDPTIEDSYTKENFKVDDVICPIEILDTAGQVVQNLQALFIFSI